MFDKLKLQDENEEVQAGEEEGEGVPEESSPEESSGDENENGEAIE